jgi:putative intracellular protease/amidase
MNLLPRDKHVMPWRIEDELKRLGANYIRADLWRGFAVRDGNLMSANCALCMPRHGCARSSSEPACSSC